MNPKRHLLATALVVIAAFAATACEPTDPPGSTTTTSTTATTAPATTTSTEPPPTSTTTTTTPPSTTTTTAPTTTAAPTTTTSTTTTTTAPDPVEEDSGDLGLPGPAFTGSSGSPSGSKPESKVWYHDGSWWGTLWDTPTSTFRIFRFNDPTDTWIPTATKLDNRFNSRADVLWTGSQLFVASHVFAEGSSSTHHGVPARLYRLSDNGATKTWTTDVGFPVQINDARSETLVIDRDSLGRIWATWMQSNKIVTAVSAPGGTGFGAPVVLPVPSATVSSDDISSIAAFGGNRIGVMWSNQNANAMYFIARNDSAPLTSWGPVEVAYSGSAAADDHINIKVDPSGRVLVAAKTSRTGSNVLIHVLDRDPATGTWTSHPAGIGSDNHTRPIIVIDDTGLVHLFATSGQSGGTIYAKTAPISALNFPPGKGEPVLVDASDPDINNPTSTKQVVTQSSGLLVLATDDSTRTYWTHRDTFGVTPTGTPPVASFTATPTSGNSPLAVGFVSTSTGEPTSYTWSFGDGTSGTGPAPTHVYDTAGLYAVSLTVTNAWGTDSITVNDIVNVSTPPPVGIPQTFTALADANVKSTSPTRNYGADQTLRVRGGSPAYASYVRFDVSGLTMPVASARLRFFVTDGSRDGGSVHSTSTAWTESGLTWANAPAATGPVLAEIGKTVAGTWVDVDVTAAVQGNGSVAFRLATMVTDSGMFSSREFTNPPQLIVTPTA